MHTLYKGSLIGVIGLFLGALLVFAETPDGKKGDASVRWFNNTIAMNSDPAYYASDHKTPWLTEMTLADCYRLALRQSEAIAIDTDLIKQTEAHFLEALSIMLPHVSIQSTDYQEEKVTTASSLSSIQTSKSSTRGFNVTQTLFSGFKAFAAMQGAGYERNQRISDKKRAEDLLFLDVADAFYLVIASREDVRALEKVRGALVDRVKELREREKLGRSRPSEVVNAKAQYYNVESNIQVAKRNEIIARQLLEFLIGGPVDTLLDSYRIPSLIEAEEYYLVKAGTRPDVKASKYAWGLAKKNIVVVDSDFLPTISGEGNYYTQRTGFNKNIDWDIMLNVSIPIFEGTEVLGRSKGAVLQAHQAELTYRHTLRNARYEIRDAYEKYRTAIIVRDALRKQYSMAILNYYLQRKDYTKNLVNNLDVLAAIQSLRDSQRDYITALYGAKQLYWQLQVAIGEDITETDYDTI
ncbi:MAG: TolC family protein [Candidatus Omnitrophica bacterium]|nr:TolC family protein [Candidatus Omnitrophota bacterium]